MERKTIGRVRGSMWYEGTGITGMSTEPNTFPESGVTKAYVNDHFLNTDPTSADRGNIYVCVLKGDADTAKWVYTGTIIGPLPDVINNLESTRTAYALSANMGRVLKGLIDGAGIYAKVIIPHSTQDAYTVSLVIENRDSVLTFTDADGNEGTYSFTAGEGTADRTVTLTVGDMFEDSGVRITTITSSAAAIKSYVLYDNNGGVFYSETPSIWGHIAEIEQNVSASGEITDGDTRMEILQMSLMTDGERKQAAAVSHTKAVWHSLEDNETAYDVIEEARAFARMARENLFYTPITDDDGTFIADDDGNVILGDWKYAVV